jgi:hypothetical protein
VTPLPDVRARSWDEVETHITVLTARIQQLEQRVRATEKVLDTFVETPWWRRWLFVADGWSGHRVVDAPAWRPWRRWWVS